MKKKIIMTKKEINYAIERIASEIIEQNRGTKNLVLIGIIRRGNILTRRLAKIIKKKGRTAPPAGSIDITLYRDDLQLVAESPVVHSSRIPFNINKKIVVLVDDVLFTGRTIRSALDEIIDFGRPKSIQLAVLIDRGHRELPIQANYIGKIVPTSKSEIVNVYLRECDGKDEVEIVRAR
ncbi:MAG TPA: bifunctional pyr operon transcriptional regulator/uracil phosphoribosyltransferase PyrR [bacterium (Candidatus Stahlbacteria)]|nr:bifunctional pyr operon transcriptional regulator/uracil phosphoribosyltransferase PyrR [Candidatus Stahlbacteria bacterium]